MLREANRQRIQESMIPWSKGVGLSDKVRAIPHWGRPLRLEIELEMVEDPIDGHIWNPLAWIIIFGPAFSTVLTLVLGPIL